MKTYLLILVTAGMLSFRTTILWASAPDDPIGKRLPGSDSLAKPLQVELVKSRPQMVDGVALISKPLAKTSSDLRPLSSARKRSLLEPAVFVMANHAIGMGMLVSMDPKETGFKPMHIRNWADGMTNPPIWDDDSRITNYILHPLWGSETYVCARSAHFGPFQSFLFSTAASVLWEYGFEAWAEHPSGQDLLVTSTVGSVIGELRYHARSALLVQHAVWAKILLVMIDPLGTLFSGATRVVGVASSTIASAFRTSGSLEPALSGVLDADVLGIDSDGQISLKLSVSL